MIDYEAVIGLEVHVQLNTQSKLFCGCATTFGAAPNSQICPVCTGQPGVLPVLNRQAVQHALRLALALRCTINTRSLFARKNYFYPDLPKAYQISQYEAPIGERGQLDILFAGQRQTIGVTRIHLEEDAGKTIHVPHAGVSRVDLNRTGVPLVEIVSEPDLRSPEQATEYMRAIRALVRALDISDGNMEEGSLRCDANVSLRPRGSDGLGTKAEIKNVNSFRFVQRALEYEIQRQRQRLSEGQAIVQETRLFDSDRGITQSMRSKEEAHDYRYFPEPDLPPLVIDAAWLAALKETVGEVPLDRRARLVAQYGLPDHDAAELTKEQALADYFEATVAAGSDPKAAANWMLSELLALVADARDVKDAPVGPSALAELLALVAAERLSGKLAKQVWPKMWASGRSAAEIAQAENLVQEHDEQAIAAQVDAVLAAHPDKVSEYRAGKEKLYGFFVGQVMRATQGKANPTLVNTLLKKRL